MVFLQLFYTFFKIGLFGFGGGYAMLSMIQGEVVTRYGWLTAQEFTDIVAISQMTPGPIGINSATYVGYTTIADCYGTERQDRKGTEELGTEGAELPVRSSPAPGEIPKGAYHHQRRAIHTGEHRAPHSFVPGCGTEGSQSARRREFRLLEPGSGPAAPRHREP